MHSPPAYSPPDYSAAADPPDDCRMPVSLRIGVALALAGAAIALIDVAASTYVSVEILLRDGGVLGSSNVNLFGTDVPATRLGTGAVVARVAFYLLAAGVVGWLCRQVSRRDNTARIMLAWAMAVFAVGTCVTVGCMVPTFIVSSVLSDHETSGLGLIDHLVEASVWVNLGLGMLAILTLVFFLAPSSRRHCFPPEVSTPTSHAEQRQ